MCCEVCQFLLDWMISTKNKSQDLAKGCDFYLEWFLQWALWLCAAVWYYQLKCWGKADDAGRVLQSLRCRNLPFARQVNVPRPTDQRVWPWFPTVLSAWKDSGKTLNFIFILSAEFWHLEIKLIWQSPSPSFLEVLVEWCLVHLKCCPSPDLCFSAWWV